MKAICKNPMCTKEYERINASQKYCSQECYFRTATIKRKKNPPIREVYRTQKEFDENMIIWKAFHK